jgi:16S rRNA (uracil1498-N3)-methyltransferase
MLDLNAQGRLADVQYNTKGFCILIGPEGGLSEQEIYAAQESGYQGVLAGPRTLRTETAALAVVAVLQSNFGDF